MITRLKPFLYSTVTRYFQIWAKRVLQKWNPVIIAVVGSAGKTTTMEFIETIIKQKLPVKSSYKTNAASAIPLNILGLHQNTFSMTEWVRLAIMSPIRSLDIPKHKMYLCEMDTDRTGEMKLHSELIKPDICCWVSARPAHTQNFDGSSDVAVYNNMLADMQQAALNTRSLLLYNAEDSAISRTLGTFTCKSESVSLKEDNVSSIVSLKQHHLSLNGTTVTFHLNENRFLNLLNHPLPYNEITITFPYALVSRVNCYGLGMALVIGISFGISKEDMISALKEFRLPPGRMSLFAGKHATTIIDSSYNSSKVATIDALGVLKIIGTKGTLAVLGDMRELGLFAQPEHEEIAREIVAQQIGRVILIGPQMKQYVLPKLIENGYKLNDTVFAKTPKEAQELLSQQGFLTSGETLLVKGSQNTLLLEGIVQSLLVSTKDKQYLCRREPMWVKARYSIYS